LGETTGSRMNPFHLKLAGRVDQAVEQSLRVAAAVARDAHERRHVQPVVLDQAADAPLAVGAAGADEVDVLAVLRERGHQSLPDDVSCFAWSPVWVQMLPSFA
jgi:hypothetical protein